MNFQDYLTFLLKNENGRYASLSLLYFIPDPIRSAYIYKVFPILQILLFIFSIFIISSVFIKNTLLFRIFFTFGFVSTFLFNINSISQGIYWITGSITHFLPLILFLLLVYVQYRMKSGINIKALDLIYFILIFLISGFNEIILIFTFFWVLYFCIYSYVYKLQRKRIYFYATLLLLILVIIIYKLPGTSSRVKSIDPFTSLNIFRSIYGTIYWGTKHSIDILFFNPTSYFISFAIIYLKKSNSLIFFKSYKLNPLFLLFITYLVILSLYFPGIFSMIGTYDRMLNSITFLTYVLFIINAINLFSFYKNINISNIYFILILFYLFFTLSHSHYKNIYHDIRSGAITKFHKQMNQRIYYFNKYKNADSILLVKIINKPYSLYITDFTYSNDDWYSIGIKKYFNLKKISLK